MHKTLMQIFEEEKLQLDDYKEIGTSKYTSHPYADDYDEFFSPWRDKNVKLLEIGALYGASTIMWDKYFVLKCLDIFSVFAEMEKLYGQEIPALVVLCKF